MTQINTWFTVAIGLGNLIVASRAGYLWVVRTPKEIAWYESAILGVIMIGSGAIGLGLIALAAGILPK